MPLLKNGQFVSDDWVTLADEAPLPDAGDVVVSFDRLQKDWESFAKFTGQVGVTVPNTARAEALNPYLSRIGLVVLTFPAFADGRAYSIARQLREGGYRGGLRASGNVLPDQLQFMRQVGFDSFDVPDRFPLLVWQKASRQMSLAYQRGLIRAAGEAEVWSERHAEVEAWEEQPHAG
jgi:uncharacterized protein (DUF934 family)